MSSRAAEALVTEPASVARHSFWPLISFRRRERRKKKDGKGWRRKSRLMAYASHSDSHIFAYYSWKLGAAYDAALEAHGLSHIVLAYRRHPLSPGASRGKSSFHFAAEAFADAAGRAACDAVSIDIRSFFDSIPHGQLKMNWKELLGTRELPADHYKVFKAVTEFASVRLRALRARLGIGRRALRNARSYGLSSGEFERQVRAHGLITVNRKAFGIPQGLPISGLLANLVMFRVDAAMNEATKSVGGTYRRYSDDILIIAPIGKAAELERRLEELLSALSLEVQDEKTARVRFDRDEAGALRTQLCDRGWKPLGAGSLQYLGMEFDGRRVLLRSQTLVRFGKRMVRAVQRARNAARRAMRKGGNPRLRRRDLFARFTHLGPHPETPPAGRPRGSLMSYAAAADRQMNEQGAVAEFMSEIRRQLRGQSKRLMSLITEADERLRQEAVWASAKRKGKKSRAHAESDIPIGPDATDRPE